MERAWSGRGHPCLQNHHEARTQQTWSDPTQTSRSYTDGSSQILTLLKRYEINGRWIEFRDALDQLRSVRAEHVHRISRLSVEDPTEAEE